MSQLEAFRSEVETFLSSTGVSPTQFGKEAIRDPRFVHDLRAGRAPGLTTVDRVIKFIRSQQPAAPAPQEQPTRAA